MADVTELRMNVAALKRVDPYVKDILDSATHVALYTFNSDNNAWEKTDVEGALFVYGRNGEPYHGIVIMNRLNTNNLVEPVSNGLDFQLQEPFLLYRNAKSRIYGVWFYDKDECIRIASVLDKLVKELDKKHEKSPKVKKGNAVDIFSMLSKAQEDFNVNKVKHKNNISDLSVTKQAPQKVPGNPELNKPELTPQSVMEFFAKASTSQYSVDNEECKGLKQVCSGLFLNQPPTIGLPSPVTRSSVTDSNGVPLKPLIQRLMSNPAHSVEHIEKQQRSVTPESKKERLPIKNDSKGTPSTLNCNSVPAKLIEKVEESVSFLRVTSPAPPAAMIAAANVGPSSAAVGELSGIDRPLSAPLCSDSTGKPALMPPVMFTSRVASKLSSGDSGCIPQVQGSPSLIKPSILGPGARSSQENSDGLTTEVSPLTRNQLLHAFKYLIRNDPEFVTNLHEAYVKSLTYYY